MSIALFFSTFFSPGEVVCPGCRAEVAPERGWVERIVNGWLAGEGALPTRLGLEEEFEAFCRWYWPNRPPPVDPFPARGWRHDARRAEREEVRSLLLAHRRDDGPGTRWLATLVATACLGENHLWQDLGFSSRNEVSELLEYAFPTLARANTGGMKWKKYFYKRLCEAEGLRLCRSPSCAACLDFQLCFGPES